MGVFGKGKKRRNHNLHNNQLMQNTFAPELALDLDSTMTGQGNTPVMVGIIEETKKNMWVCLDKAGHIEQQH